MPTLRVNRPRVLLYAPTLYEAGFKQHHVDGEALALHVFLGERGYDSRLLDAYYRARPAPSLADVVAGEQVDAIVVHLWTSDAYGPRLRRIADDLAAVRAAHQIPVLGFGPLATSAATELRAHGAIDHAAGLLPAAPAGSPVLDRLAADIAAHLRGHTPLTGLSRNDLMFAPDAVVSVATSRGCRSRCTFCAYNADLGGGWSTLPIPGVVADIAHLHRLTGASRFAFSDTDFGGGRDQCRDRATQLRDGIRRAGLHERITLAVNIRAETLDPATVAILAEAGVRTFLIGVESFNEHTLRRLYGKRQDLDHLRMVVRAADENAITTVASYILWHPWQTLPSLRAEIAAIDEFGRWRVPQFMARSRLLIIPGTVAEKQIRTAGLLERAPFHRAFRFADPAAAELHQRLAGWFQQAALPVLAHLSEHDTSDLDTLSRLKINEWSLLRTWLAADEHPQAHHG